MNINWTPSDYAKACILANEVGKELLARLDWITLEPKQILDIGCGIGEQSANLQKRYPDANIFSLDISMSMLEYAKKQYKNLFYVCADSHYLSFANQSLDLIFANLFLPWQMDLKKILREWRRVLRMDGLLIFTAFGPDTLKECLQVNKLAQVIDMHDLGDLLLQENFADPILDVTYFTLSYRDKNILMKELCATGFMSNTSSLDIQPSKEGKFITTYEMIYGHAFAPGATQVREEDGTVKVPVSMLRRNRS